jgi:23S rRNA (guanine2445-N2)-methyltransferase / 23S rRNA (guanine2069-N7)-methyltransferase
LSKETLSPDKGKQMVANRLRKNMRNLSRWLRSEDIHCYRLYDADIPEYAVAVDIYEGEHRLVHVQEYAPPRSIDPEKAQRRLGEALQAVREVLEVGDDQLFVKVRRQQKGAAQYEKLASSGEFHEVSEGGCRFLVNLQDYLDTGLFLDHRITRSMLAELAQGRRFLNLFAYTGAGSVHAASGGAVSTLTIDMSKTYLDWARRNMVLNGFEGSEHRYLQANCVEWLEKATSKQKFGLIFLDPPSFSTSKRMQSVFDVQRDHVMLVRNCMKILEPDGVLIFSNNLRKFRMDFEALAKFAIEDISRKTLPRDFERNPRIHNCWKITF